MVLLLSIAAATLDDDVLSIVSAFVCPSSRITLDNMIDSDIIVQSAICIV